jgi:agmatinase
MTPAAAVADTTAAGAPTAGRGTGIATFAGLPWAGSAAGADIAVLGVPFDAGGAVRVGARYGPHALRTQSMRHLRGHHRQHARAPAAELRCVDLGDVAIAQELPAESRTAIQRTAADALSTGASLLAFGGDHATTLPLLRATAAACGEPLALVHLDAHQDVVEDYYAGAVRYNNGTVFRRACEEGLLAPERSIQIGMNGPLFPGMFPADSRALGLSVVDADRAAALGPEAVGEQIRATVGDAWVYLSFDMDVVDAAFAPGTGAPEVGGLTSREALGILRQLGGLRLRAADVVELNPLFDSADITAILAANVAFDLLTLLAMARD